MRKALLLTTKAGPFRWWLLGCALFAASAHAAAGEIDPARLRQHVAVLASDAYAGREAGGPADRKTTRYIVKAFESAGLSPGWKGEWLQQVPLIRRSTLAARLSWRAEGREDVRLPPDALTVMGDEAIVRFKGAPVVFAGYGIVDPSTGRDDLAGADLSGALVLRLPGSPPEYQKPGTAAPDLDARRALYLQRGALGEIAINESDDAGFARIEAGYRRGIMRLESQPTLPVTGHVRAGVAAPLFEALGVSLDDLKARAARPGFRATPLGVAMTGNLETALRRFRSPNVIGRIEGKTLADQAVLVTSHWDAYGICLPNGAADRICNGAVDNASGVAGLIELAATLRKGEPPRRTILFIATTAEEHGLLGADHYARDPAVPLVKTVGGVNLDSIALRGRGAKLAVVGRGLTTLDPIIGEALKVQGRALLDDQAVQQFYTRSDQYALARRGVPMVMMTGLFSRETAEDDAIDRYFKERYHQPGDEIEAIPSFEGAAEDLELALAIIRRLANDTVPPAWTADSPYQRREAR